ESVFYSVTVHNRSESYGRPLNWVYEVASLGPFFVIAYKNRNVSVIEGFNGVYEGLLGMVGVQGNSLLPLNPCGVASLFPSRAFWG
ncbi:MAG: hypothetical protein O6837_06560, partial [Deltaproteobacteria bacterium]|nr:hypothetical protein [Deltaproteobacteria bacterium]